jgi:hypothetical protein
MATEKHTVSDRITKWARRLTSIAVCVALIRWYWLGTPPTLELRQFVARFEIVLRVMPADRVVLGILAAWYAFLTQLKFRWVFWLPFYLPLFPAAWLVGTVSIRLFAGPVVRLWRLLTDNKELDNKKVTPASLPLKRLWVLFFFVWVILFRDIAWAAWIPTALALPIWFFFLRLCYQCAVTPRTFTSLLVAASNALLDSQIKSLNEAKTKRSKPASSVFACNIAELVLKRYSDDRVLGVIQRESLALFSLSLVTALMASAWFWGLAGLALVSLVDGALESYTFFSSYSLVEFVLWAWGCMTTTIDFPGSGAPIWLKFLHALILVTGLFQLTFLLACFSIMTSAESSRSAEEARKILQSARDKLKETRALEATAFEILDVEKV